MNNPDQKFKALAQQCLSQIGRIDRSATLSGLSSRTKSLEKWVERYTKAATVESNKMLTVYEEEHGEEKAEAYRDTLIASVQKQIHPFTKKILG